MTLIRDIFSTFTLMFLAISLSLTYFGFAAFYSVAMVLKVAFVISLLYTTGKYISKAVARAFDPEKN